MKFATKLIPHNPSHLRHVASTRYTTLGNLKFKFSADIQYIWKRVQTNCIFIASNFVIHPQILIFSVFQMASFPYACILIANKFFCVTVFLYLLFTFTINSWHQKFVTADVTATINMVFSNEDKS